MTQQPNSNKHISIDGDASVEGQVGQAGRDLIQTVTVYEGISIAGLFRREVKPPTQQEYRWRKKLLDQVQQYWVKDVLERSLHNQVMIDLGLEARDDLVERPFGNIQISPQESQQPISITGSISTVFGRLGEGRTLLILGEPGAGKTTMLLKLTRDLIAKTDQNLNQPIPVVLNLSSWAKKQQKIAEWLVDELLSNYGANKSLGKYWVQEQQLLLLLDGLDEVKAQHREACVQAINQFMQDYGLVEMVVCSRIKDYEALSCRLKLRGGIYVQPLTSEQINQYLDKAGSQLQGLRTLLQQDTALQEMMKSPLTLSIVSIAYKDISAENLPQMGSIKERRRHLFDTYIEQMFHRHGRTKTMKYKPEQTKHWLTWLATRMVQESRTVFLIEKMQPTWLKTKAERIFYRIASGVTSGLIFGPILGIISGLILWFFRLISAGLVNGLQDGLISGLISGLIYGLICGLAKGEIQTVESLKFSGQEFKKNSKKGLQFGLLSGLIYGLIFGLYYRLTQTTLIMGIISGLISGLLYTIIQATKGPEIESKKSPNQGIKNSTLNAVLLGLLPALIVVPIRVLIYRKYLQLIGIDSKLLWEVFVIFGVFDLGIGLIFGGGIAVIQHFILHYFLTKKSVLPWNYTRFLDDATELIFMQKVGGGYIFIHRMLLEHFAQVEPETIPESSVQISQSIDLVNKQTLEGLNYVQSEQAQTSESESVSHKICSNCHHENLPDSSFCSQCGTALNSC
ncbi:MAG: NACHT domain-containing protein [Okeania sp. SIO2C9]|uniref:NACHT domain-containing protein n=1 Tax=Okeania sp. SIO2C9 TaxID=2607791 RepID=UPI0013BF0A41|nr:NACHT domain-containing protein [Okeania sp. SIO2C9]NEQ75677.1 NACHT domain-containing protein [Okeania sp. SIO2C9]